MHSIKPNAQAAAPKNPCCGANCGANERFCAGAVVAID